MADGLFSYKTPGQLQQDYLGGLMQPVGGGDLYSQLVQTMSNAGRIAGYGAGRMFGGQVPGEEKNAAIQSVFEQVKGIADPIEQYNKAAELFAQSGFPDLAMQARKTAQQEQLTGLQLEKAEFDINTLRGKQTLKAELAKLPKTATSEDVLSVAKRFGDPASVIEFAQKDIQAKAEAKAKLELEREKAATKQEIERDKLEQRRREQEDRIELKRLMAAQTKATTDLQRQNLAAQVAEREARLDERKQKQEAQERALKIKQDFMGRQVSKMLDDVKDAKDVVNEFSTGTGSNLLSALSWTDANKLANRLAAIKANIGFDKLQAMREASPTGGALGQVAVQELVALQNSIASLEQNQRPSELKRNLEKIETHYRNLQRIYSGDITEESVNQAGGAMSDDPLGLR